MVLLIGIDCATQPNKVGLALGELEGDVVRIKACKTGGPKRRPAAIATKWLQPRNPALLALDAPLGCQPAIGQALAAIRCPTVKAGPSCAVAALVSGHWWVYEDPGRLMHSGFVQDPHSRPAPVALS